MKDIEEMTLEELKEEKEKIMRTLFLTAAAYKMQRVLAINKQIEKLKLTRTKKMGE